MVIPEIPARIGVFVTELEQVEQGFLEAKGLSKKVYPMECMCCQMARSMTMMNTC